MVNMIYGFSLTEEIKHSGHSFTSPKIHTGVAKGSGIVNPEEGMPHNKNFRTRKFKSF